MDRGRQLLMDEAGYGGRFLLDTHYYLAARKIFVGGLHWNTTDGKDVASMPPVTMAIDGLRAYFEQFGQVIECHIMRDPTGKSRCFGFLTFSDSSVVDTILQKTHILDKKQVSPSPLVCSR